MKNIILSLATLGILVLPTDALAYNLITSNTVGGLYTYCPSTVPSAKRSFRWPNSGLSVPFYRNSAFTAGSAAASGFSVAVSRWYTPGATAITYGGGVTNAGVDVTDNTNVIAPAAASDLGFEEWGRRLFACV